MVSWNWDNLGKPSNGYIATHESVVGVLTVKDIPTSPEQPYAFVRGNGDYLWVNWWG